MDKLNLVATRILTCLTSPQEKKDCTRKEWLKKLTWQAYGLSPEWIIMCVFRFPFWVNGLWQMGHINCLTDVFLLRPELVDELLLVVELLVVAGDDVDDWWWWPGSMTPDDGPGWEWRVSPTAAGGGMMWCDGIVIWCGEGDVVVDACCEWWCRLLLWWWWWSPDGWWSEKEETEAAGPVVVEDVFDDPGTQRVYSWQSSQGNPLDFESWVHLWLVRWWGREVGEMVTVAEECPPPSAVWVFWCWSEDIFSR